jgi:anthranilate synthase/aminodeoxychorismate synthase-like glutamine amidotransferase
MKVLVVDNYDSFAYNLVQYMGELGADVDTVRNDRAGIAELIERGYDRCVVSPGPCTPDDAGISLDVVRAMPEAGIPTLGVCLGHQSLAQAFGGRVVLHPPVHGKSTVIEHDGRTIFCGLPSPLTVGRYHSLVVDPRLPDCLEQSASGDGVLMGLRHRELPAEGVQFHPESVLTQAGKSLLANFLGDCTGGGDVAGRDHTAGDGDLADDGDASGGER